MVGHLLAEGQLWFSVFHATIDKECPDDALGIVGAADVEQAGHLEHKADLVTYFGNFLCTDQRKQFYYKVQAVRQGDTSPSVELASNKYVNMALLYMYRKGTQEIKHFCKDKKIDKIAVEKEGVLLSSGRLLDKMNFLETAELSSLDLGSLGVKVNLPMIERYSPLAYSLVEHIHWDIARHRGI